MGSRGTHSDKVSKELFTVVAPADALRRLAPLLAPLDRFEALAVEHARDRVAASDVISRDELPSFARSTMDGFAVVAADTFGASESSPAYLRLIGEVAMGSAATQPLTRNCAIRVHTGAMLPPGADAVIMLEDTNERGEEIEVLATVAPGEDVLVPGEDVCVGDVVVHAGARLRAADLGALAAVGTTTVRVYERPRVAILSSGDEVVAPDQFPGAGQVRDVNASTISALMEAAGAIAVHFGIVPDDAGAMFARAREALASADMLVISAGSSVSTRDMTAEVIAQLGEPGVLVHGIAIKPGKPTILAMCAGKPVIGLPGNPVSALVVAWRCAAPIVRALGGESLDLGAIDDRTRTIASLTQNVPSRPGREDYVPVKLERTATGAWNATPIFGKSNLIFTLVRSDGIAIVPLDRSGLAAGSLVDVVRL